MLGGLNRCLGKEQRLGDKTDAWGQNRCLGPKQMLGDKTDAWGQNGLYSTYVKTLLNNDVYNFRVHLHQLCHPSTDLLVTPNILPPPLRPSAAYSQPNSCNFRNILRWEVFPFVSSFLSGLLVLMLWLLTRAHKSTGTENLYIFTSVVGQQRVPQPAVVGKHSNNLSKLPHHTRPSYTTTPRTRPIATPHLT
jgi:hypothetical protein